MMGRVSGALFAAMVAVSAAVTALAALAYAARLFYKLRGGRSPGRPNI